MLFVCAALALGCKGKPTTEEAPATVGSAAAKPSANPSADLKLPERPTTPPVKKGKRSIKRSGEGITQDYFDGIKKPFAAPAKGKIFAWVSGGMSATSSRCSPIAGSA